eukprot:UN27481
MTEDFSRVYTWGVQRQMIFDASKFNLINCYRKKHLARGHKHQISFGTERPEWVSSAKLLGILFDAKLSFKEELTRIAGKVHGTTFRIYNHVDWTHGLSIVRLLQTYHTWIEPSLAYGSPVWI